MTTHLEILQHSAGMDQYGRRQQGTERNFFGTQPESSDGNLCEELVLLGLMYRDRVIAWAARETIYCVTKAGFDYIQEKSPSPPKQTASQRRYLEFLREDSGMTFHEWLLCQKHRKRECYG